jgi:hypothetical protein
MDGLLFVGWKIQRSNKTKGWKRKDAQGVELGMFQSYHHIHYTFYLDLIRVPVLEGTI